MANEKAKVFFTDFRTSLDVSQGVKLQKLCRKAGIGQLDRLQHTVSRKQEERDRSPV